MGTTWERWGGYGDLELCWPLLWWGVWYVLSPNFWAHFFWRSVGPPWCVRCRPAFFSSLYTVCLSLAFWRQSTRVVGAGMVWSRISLSNKGCNPSLNLIITPISYLLYLASSINLSKSTI